MVTCALLTYCFIIDKGGIWSNFLGGYQGRVLYRIVATTVIILQPRKEKSTSTEGTAERGQGLPRNQENPHQRGNGDAHTTEPSMDQLKAQILRTSPTIQEQFLQLFWYASSRQMGIVRKGWQEIKMFSPASVYTLLPQPLPKSDPTLYSYCAPGSAPPAHKTPNKLWCARRQQMWGHVIPAPHPI